jgi:formate hydrogenlyase transcriptional activator
MANDSTARDLDLLLSVTNLLITRHELGDLFEALSECLGRVVQHDYASVSLTGGPGIGHALVRLVVLDQVRHPELEGRTIGITEDSQGRFARDEPLVYDIQYLLERNPDIGKILEPEGLCSFCTIPLRSARTIVGLLSVASRQKAAFSEQDTALLKRVSGQIAVAIENALAFEQISHLTAQLAHEKEYLEDEIRSEQGFADLVGSTASFQQILDQVATVAPTGATVLLTGETGTGKELVARAIHGRSERRTRTFVRVNCATIPATLVESELFGHERGAFTGAASSRVGRFEIASGGTLFLDEAGDLPLEVQPKLLRALQEREFERLGSSRVLRSDARVIAATNRELPGMVEAGSFRKDLFYRLNVFPIHLPPLRERREDIPLLVSHFVRKHSHRLRRPTLQVSDSVMRTLVKWDWPGNVRELENVIERAVIVSKGGTLTVTTPGGPASAPVATSHSRNWLADAERVTILDALRKSNGVIGGPNGAAFRLGVKRTTLQSKMRKLGIAKPPY